MANRLLRNPQVLENGIVKLYGSFVTTTSGTVGSTACKGFTIAKTATTTGRYTITLNDTWVGFKNLSAVILGTADAAMTTGKGILYFIRGVDLTAKTILLQFCSPDGSPADAELEDAAVVYIELTMKNSSAY